MTISTASIGSTSDAPPGCVADVDCDDDLPICWDGTCVECTPADDGRCTSVGHVCEPVAHECVPCDAHGDCEIGACHIFEGTCFPADTQVVELGGSMESIASVAANVSPGGYLIILLPGNEFSAHENTSPIVVDGGKIIAILDDAPGYPRPRIHAEEMLTYAIQITGGATLYMQGVEVSGHAGMGLTPLACQGAARLDARGTMVTNNVQGTSILDCEARFESCFFQSGSEGGAALSVAGNSDVELVYTTLVTNAGAGNNAVLSCSDSSSILVRNSLLLSQGDDLAPEISQSCSSIVLEHSIIESPPALGVGNGVLEPPLTGGDDYTGWFCGYDSGNLHLNLEAIDAAFLPLMTSSSRLQIAVPAIGDEPRDIDGDARSTSAMVGADVPVLGLCPL